MPQKPVSRRFVIVDDATICEARDHQVERERPNKKRQRVDSDEEDVGQGQDDVPLGDQRDPELWVDLAGAGEEMVLRLGNTLFRVNSAIFNDCRQFVGYAKKPAQYTESSPLDVEQVIRWPRDEKDEFKEGFRDLLWALDVLHDAPRLTVTPRNHDEAERILRAAELAHKFDIPSLSTWAVGIAQRACADDSYMTSCSSLVLRKLVEIAHRANKPELVCAVASKWADRVLKKDAPSVPAIQIAEEYKLLELRGIAYYVHLLEMGDFQTVAQDGVVTEMRSDPKLTGAQVLRLLSGHYSLVSFWERYRMVPATLEQKEGCNSARHTQCTHVWGKRWNSAVGWKRIMSYNSADVLGLLNIFREQLSGDDELKVGLTPSCRQGGLDLLVRKREEVKRNLTSHFQGCV